MELLGHKRHGFGWGTAEVIWYEAHEAQRTELQGIAETVMGSARARYALVISVREGKEDDEVLIRDHFGEAIALGPFGLGKELHWHSHLRVDGNQGHHPHIRWTKIPDLVHVYCGISSINRVFFPTLFGLPRTFYSDCHGLSNRLINTNTSRRSLFFAPKLREPLFLQPNNGMSGLFSWINAYRRRFSLLNLSTRGLDGSFS